jgi:hypothetical protein
MEKRFELAGGGELKATTTQEAAERLREMSFNPCNSLEDYMRSTSAACKIYSSSVIRFDNVDNFINDLIDNEFMKEVK